MARESNVIRACLEHARRRPRCVIRKRHGGAFGVAGDADLTGCCDGRHVEVECKPPGWRPRSQKEADRHALQLRRLDEWRAAGAVVGVVTSAAEFAVLLDLCGPGREQR